MSNIFHVISVGINKLCWNWTHIRRLAQTKRLNAQIAI
jgi:hypothetical protein